MCSFKRGDANNNNNNNNSIRDRFTLTSNP